MGLYKKENKSLEKIVNLLKGNKKKQERRLYKFKNTVRLGKFFLYLKKRNNFVL